MSSRQPVTHADLAAAGSRPTRLACALAYAALGIPVLPLHHPVGPSLACSCGDPEHTRGGSRAREIGKHPRTPRGLTDASTDPETIRHWWWTWPASNIGLATGHRFDVIDVDHTAGLQMLTDLSAAGRAPQQVATATTGRPGGIHWVVPVTGAGNSQGGERLPGVDFRGMGGFVVTAPSLHRTGVSYRWAPVALPVGDAARGRSVEVALPWHGSPLPEGVNGRQRAFALKALSELCVEVGRSRASQRNPALWKAGIRMGTMTGAGWVDRDHVERELLSSAATSGTDGVRAEDTLQRSLDAGSRKPAPALPERPDQSLALPVEDVAGSILEWAASPDATRLIGARSLVNARLVIAYACAAAVRAGSRRVSLPIREVEGATGLSSSTAARVLKRLSEAQVLRLHTGGSYTTMTGSVYELTTEFVAKRDSVVAKRWGTFGALSRFATTAAGSPVHDVWGARRGLGRGLTQTDRALLGHLPLEGPVSTTSWAISALGGPGSRQTAYRASDPNVPGSLAALGLVRRAARGFVEMTDAGRQVIADGAAGLDGLAVDLGVAGRSDNRSERIGNERAEHHLERVPEVIDDALRGNVGRTVRARVVVKGAVPDEAYVALDRLLLGLDETDDPRVLRSAAARVVAIAGLTEEDAADRAARGHQDILAARRASGTAAALSNAAVTPQERADADRAVAAAAKRTRRAAARSSEPTRLIAEQDRDALLRWHKRTSPDGQGRVGGPVWDAAQVAVAVAASGRVAQVPVDLSTGEVLTGDLADRRTIVRAILAFLAARNAIDPERTTWPTHSGFARRPESWQTKPAPGYGPIRDWSALRNTASGSEH